MFKKILPLISVGLFAFPSVCMAETQIDALQSEVKEINVAQKEPLNSTALSIALIAGSTGTNSVSTDEAIKKLNEKGEDTTGLAEIEDDYESGLTDKWLVAATSKMNGFGGIDTSIFKTFETKSNSLTTNLYKIGATKMLEAGWGKVPTDGVFSEANGFKGYSITGDMKITAQDLFEKEYSDVYSSFKKGSFISDMKGLREMTDKFDKNFKAESDTFSGSEIYKASMNLIKTVDIDKGLEAYRNTPKVSSAASLANFVGNNTALTDTDTYTSFKQASGEVTRSAISPVSDYLSQTGQSDIFGAARAQFENNQAALKQAVNYNETMSTIDTVGSISAATHLSNNVTSIIMDGFIGNIANFFSGDNYDSDARANQVRLDELQLKLEDAANYKTYYTDMGK